MNHYGIEYDAKIGRIYAGIFDESGSLQPDKTDVTYACMRMTGEYMFDNNPEFTINKPHAPRILLKAKAYESDLKHMMKLSDYAELTSGNDHPMIRCTKENGDPVYIMLDHISAVTALNGGTVVYTDESPDTYWRIKESVDEVIKMIQGPAAEEIHNKIAGGDGSGKSDVPIPF